MIYIWSDALAQSVAYDDDFFADLHGNSLRAVELVETVAEHYGVDLEVDLVFDNPTPGQMYDAILQLHPGIETQGCGDTAGWPPGIDGALSSPTS
jgi:acyl carrier protein